MGETTAEQLSELEIRVETALGQVPRALAAISSALTAGATQDATAIASHTDALREVSRSVHTDLLTVVARQRPVAHDLRLVLALTQLAHSAGLIANQFELINDQLVHIDAGVVYRQGTAETLSRMTILAADQLRDAVYAFASRNVALAEEINGQDNAIDHLNRQVFEAALELDGVPDQRELAFRHVLIARSLERVGDNAVDIAEQAAFLVNAELRQFTDASHPHKRP